jgi:hypothetical protein
MNYSLKFNNSISHFFIHPFSLNLEWYQLNFPNSNFLGKEDYLFKNIDGYNKLMMSKDLYTDLLEKANYTCILQPDAILFRDISKINFEQYDFIAFNNKICGLFHDDDTFILKLFDEAVSFFTLLSEHFDLLAKYMYLAP